MRLFNILALGTILLASTSACISRIPPKPYYVPISSESMIRVGFITIDNPVVLKWYNAYFIANRDNLPENISEKIFSEGNMLYVLANDVNFDYDYLWIAPLQHPNLGNDSNRDSISNAADKAWGEYNQDYTCCRLTMTDSISKNLKIMQFVEAPKCYALALIEQSYYNSRRIPLDGPFSEGIKFTHGPVSFYFKIVYPVCCYKDTTNIPKILPWQPPLR